MYFSIGFLRRDYLIGVSLIIGVFLVFPAITGILPSQYAAPFEWAGVFCLMNGLTCLFSTRRALAIAFTAVLAGTLLDPIFFSGQPFQTWVRANALVLIFALIGAFTGVMIQKYTNKTIRGKLVPFPPPITRDFAMRGKNRDQHT